MIGDFKRGVYETPPNRSPPRKDITMEVPYFLEIPVSLEKVGHNETEVRKQAEEEADAKVAAIKSAIEESDDISNDDIDKLRVNAGLFRDRIRFQEWDIKKVHR